jgi:hypothetical protein
VKSTVAISTSDCPFFWHGWQHFDEKRYPNFRKWPFQPLIGDLTPYFCPEMSSFSHDTAADSSEDGLGQAEMKGRPVFRIGLNSAHLYFTSAGMAGEGYPYRR